MSRIKELKTQPEFNINIVDMLTTLIPVKKTKYVELFINLMKRTRNIDEYNNNIKQTLMINYKLSKEDVEKIPEFQLAFFYQFLYGTFDVDDINKFQKFCEYNERGIISQNDLTKYTSFDVIKNQVSLADMRVQTKELEKQIHKIYDNDEWLILRPLTFESSLKYGSNTKWCTTMENEYYHFRKYTTNGILIYVINKITGVKVATHKELATYGELTFWNQTDQRIDSLESGIPLELLMIIKNEITENPVANNTLLNKELFEKEESLLNNILKKTSGEDFISPGMHDDNEAPALVESVNGVYLRQENTNTMAMGMTGTMGIADRPGVSGEISGEEL